jgi:hypothetical protein
MASFPTVKDGHHPLLRFRGTFPVSLPTLKENGDTETRFYR